MKSEYKQEIVKYRLERSIIRTKNEWNSPKYSSMPFKKNIEKEGILL